MVIVVRQHRIGELTDQPHRIAWRDHGHIQLPALQFSINCDHDPSDVPVITAAMNAR